MLANAINPEIAAGHVNYVRNFRLLAQAKSIVIQGTALLGFGLWLTCCFFLLKAKEQSFWWLPLAILGPFGLAALTLSRRPDASRWALVSTLYRRDAAACARGV